ncbi:hypothetical protein BSNK01_24860 [Bacillaceae bacterium]
MTNPMSLLQAVINNFFVALGIVVGGSILGGLAAFLNQQPPMNAMESLADKLKIWGLVGTLGGTLDTFMQLERVFTAELSPVVKQVIYILSAYAGAHTGSEIIRWLAGKP